MPPLAPRLAAAQRDPSAADRAIHLTQVGLARRWLISPRTLERWRWKRTGPRFVKIGGRVLYRLADVEDFEKAHEHLADMAAIAG